MRHPREACSVYWRMWRSGCRVLRRVRLLCLLLLPLGVVGEVRAEPNAWSPYQPFGKRISSRVKRSNNTYGSHYFASFSAIPLRKQTGFYKNTMVSLNTVAYGLTEHLSAAGSIDLVSLIRARDGGPVYSGRLQVSGSTSEVFHLGASVTYLNTRVPVGAPVAEGVVVPPGFFLGMAMCTIGNKDNQLTIAGGWTHDGRRSGRSPVVNIGGAVRAFTNVMFVTEHWIFTDPDRDFIAHSFGARILGDDLAIDIGLAYDKEYTIRVTRVGMPFLGATLNF